MWGSIDKLAALNAHKTGDRDGKEQGLVTLVDVTSPCCCSQI